MKTRRQPRALQLSLLPGIRIWAFLVALLLILPMTALAQTYTITSGFPQPLTINNVHAGDLVTVDATLFSGDPNENGEGEPLVAHRLP